MSRIRRPVPPTPVRATGLPRRRARRLPPIAAQLEPDVELFDLPEDPDPPAGCLPEALCAPESHEGAPRAMATPGSDQGERERPPRMRYPRDGVPVIDLAAPGPSAPRPRPRPRPDPQPQPQPAASPARLEWDRQRAEVGALMAAHDAVMAEYNRGLAVRELRSRLDRL